MARRKTAVRRVTSKVQRAKEPRRTFEVDVQFVITGAMLDDDKIITDEVKALIGNGRFGFFQKRAWGIAVRVKQHNYVPS
jgi:hypothetical protein